MLRRTLLLGLAAGLGLSGRYATAADAAPGASAVMASTKTSPLLPRPVTPAIPAPAVLPAPVSAVGRLDLAFTRNGRSLPTRVWYPVGPGPYPVIVFSHGLLSQPDDYAALLIGWALAGFVVAAPLYPHTSFGTGSYNIYDIVNQPADASAVLTQVLATEELTGRVDPTRLVAAGHSAGGITTTGLFSDRRDDRLKAGVVLAGTDFLGAEFTGPAAPLMFVQGELDTTVAWSAARTVFEAVPWSRAMLTLPAGGHVTTAAEYRTITPATVAFLRWSLYGAEAGLVTAAAVGGIATLDDQRSAARTPAMSSGSTS
ncbi:MAG: chlorophyllase [Actinoplanes sp.]